MMSGLFVSVWWLCLCGLAVVVTGTEAQLEERGVRSKGTQEYCETETFRAQCNSHEVVVMDTAFYGRMEVGRCVEKDYGYVGCEKDVLTHMDSKCSGRRRCEIRIPDATLDTITVCPKDFKTYLQASYKCYNVQRPQCVRRACHNGTVIPVYSGSGYLASVTVEENGCGTGQCPWVLQAQPGQRLNLTLIDFSVVDVKTPAPSPHTSVGGGAGGGASPSLDHINSQSVGEAGAGGSASASAVAGSPLSIGLGYPSDCFRYATVAEMPYGKPKHVCSSPHRHQHIYSSANHSLQIQVSNPRLSTKYFMIKYTVVGCPTYHAPEHMWVEHLTDHVIVRCQSSGWSKELYCRNNEWVGELDHCLPPPVGSSLYGDDGSILPMGILIAVIVAIALIIGIVILTLGLVVIKRRRMHNAAGTALAMTSSGGTHCARAYINKDASYNTSSRQPLYQPTKPPLRYTVQQQQQHHQQQQIQHHHQQQQQQQLQYYNDYLQHQHNLYDYKMKMRPLPNVPAPGSGSVGGPGSDVTTNSERPLVGDGSGYHGNDHNDPNQEDFCSIKSDDVESLDGPQYFELESDGPTIINGTRVNHAAVGVVPGGPLPQCGTPTSVVPVPCTPVHYHPSGSSHHLPALTAHHHTPLPPPTTEPLPPPPPPTRATLQAVAAVVTVGDGMGAGGGILPVGPPPPKPQKPPPPPRILSPDMPTGTPIMVADMQQDELAGETNANYSW